MLRAKHISLLAFTHVVGDTSTNTTYRLDGREQYYFKMALTFAYSEAHLKTIFGDAQREKNPAL